MDEHNAKHDDTDSNDDAARTVADMLGITLTEGDETSWRLKSQLKNSTIVYRKDQDTRMSDEAKSAFVTALAAARNGDIKAQLQLAEMYRRGEGVECDHGEAFVWLLAAAERGDAGAQFMVGCEYRSGHAAKQESTQANYWFEKAAHQNHVAAQKRLAKVYESEAAYEPARAWYERAAALGDPEAMFRLGQLYASGKGTEKNYVKAVALWRDAAEKDNWDAEYRLRMACALGLATPDACGKENPIAWWNAVADRGNAFAQFVLGVLYEIGRHVPADRDEALRWYRKSSDQGYEPAQSRLDQLIGCDEDSSIPPDASTLIPNDPIPAGGYCYEFVEVEGLPTLVDLWEDLLNGNGEDFFEGAARLTRTCPFMRSTDYGVVCCDYLGTAAVLWSEGAYEKALAHFGSEEVLSEVCGCDWLGDSVNSCGVNIG